MKVRIDAPLDTYSTKRTTSRSLRIIEPGTYEVEATTDTVWTGTWFVLKGEVHGAREQDWLETPGFEVIEE